MAYLGSSKNDIEDTGWKTLSSTYGVSYRKKAGIVFVRAQYQGGVTTQISVGTLPIGYRPSMAVIVSNYNQGNFTDSNYMAVGISGEVTFNGTGNKWMNCIVSYPEN